MVDYESVVIGAGPGGLSTVAALLDTGVTSILWVDREFTGGRLNTLYREISSNTKTGIYLDAIGSSPTCNRIIDSTPSPHAVDRMRQMNKDETCQLSLAGDMVMMLIEGILRLYGGVEKCVDEVKSAELEVGTLAANRVSVQTLWDGETWTVQFASGRTVTTAQLHLSTGAHPRKPSFHRPYNDKLTILDLDQTMVLSSLPSLLPSDQQSTVGIIGNSHSGILACMNFHTIATSDNPDSGRDVKVINFQRREILFAEYRDDGIVWDNSGLKGRTADWAKREMVDKPSSKVIEQVRLDRYEGGEEAAYRQYLPECTHLVYAIGYDRSPLPSIIVNGTQCEDQLEFDMHTSGFVVKQDQGKSKVHGLYGTGIAFPEETEDPEGHVEAAVGLAKFFKFAERVKGDWGKVC